MKIIDIKLYYLSTELNSPLIWASGRTNKRETILIQILTDEGVIGWGECININTFQTIKEIGTLLIGMNPLHRNHIHNYIHSIYRKANCASGLVIRALGAIDIALWDIYGKFYNQPIHELLGGKIRDSVLIYASGGYPNEDLNLKLVEDELEKYAAEKYQAVKLKIGYHSIEFDMERIKVARRVLGDKIGIMVDGNQSYDFYSSIQMGEKLSQYQILWFEEPIPVNRLEQYRNLREKMNIPIAAGENYHSYDEFHDVLSLGVVDILQPNVSNIGGLTEAIKILPLAWVLGRIVCPHTWGTPLLNAATLHYCSTIPNYSYALNSKFFYNEPIMEYDCTENPIREYLCIHDMQIKNGYISLPSKSGLGVDIDLYYLNKFKKDYYHIK